MNSYSSNWNTPYSVGNPNSFLVPLKKSHLQSFKDYTKCVVGSGDLHIIIHRRGQKLSILRPTPNKQSAERLRVSSWPRLERDRHFFFWVSSKPRLEKGRLVEAAIRERRTFFGGLRETFFKRKEPQSLEERQTFWAVRLKRRMQRNDFVNRAGSIRTKRWK